jgi:uncharacterized membrane protein YvbJ
LNSLRAPETCPNCGADVPAGAKSCPECGADEHTGWSEDACASGLDLPDDSFDYNEFVQREFESGKKPMPFGIRWYWWLAAIIILAVFVVAIARQVRFR